MSELIDILNSISQQNQNAQKPADVAFGTVVSTAPLSIQVDGSIQPIPSTALILTAAVTARRVNVQGGSGGTVLVNEGLSAGDKVIMLRVSKGNRYIVLSKAQ
ncbi:DUF2577 domain-containing protein [Lachnospiraceae bacterium 62-35]